MHAEAVADSAKAQAEVLADELRRWQWHYHTVMEPALRKSKRNVTSAMAPLEGDYPTRTLFQDPPRSGAHHCSLSSPSGQSSIGAPPSADAGNRSAHNLDATHRVRQLETRIAELETNNKFLNEALAEAQTHKDRQRVHSEGWMKAISEQKRDSQQEIYKLRSRLRATETALMELQVSEFIRR